METFHGSEKLKQELVEKALEHERLDKIIRGKYWDGEKGCSVGCILNDPGGGHHLYPEKFGIPEWVAHIQDELFEGMSVEKSRTWTSEFFKAIPVGVDLDDARKPFLLVIVRHALSTLEKLRSNETLDRCKEAVKSVISALRTGYGVRKAAEAAWAAARAAARAEEWAAEAAAEEEEWAAEAVRAAWVAARAAVWAAAWAAARAAEWAEAWAGARAEAWAGAWAAGEARAAWAAAAARAEAAREAAAARAVVEETYDHADELLKIFRGVQK